MPLVKKIVGDGFKGKKLTEEESNRLDQLHEDYLKVIRKPGCYSHNCCESEKLRRVYTRSTARQEPDPKVVEDGRYHSHYERRRQFVPFGWYCPTCDTFMTNEQRERLYVEMRIMRSSCHGRSLTLYPEIKDEDTMYFGYGVIPALSKLQPDIV